MMINRICRHSRLIASLLFLLFYTEHVFALRAAIRPLHLELSLRTEPAYEPYRFLPAGGAARSNPEQPVAEPSPAGKTNAGQRSAGEPANKGAIGGPSQPEMQAFQSANANNMVDLFSGDFSYNIPLMDVGGYPVNLSYRGGITMDQEASWVGLGWNINPGTITRNLRGLPDDFNGKSDSIKKVTSIRENKTVGVTAGGDFELTGLPMRVGASTGVFHNNYKGWGVENSVNASINSGTGAKGPLSGGLSITNNSQEGLTIAPSLSVKFSQYDAEEKGGYGSLTTSLPYNSRAGLKAMQLSVGVSQYRTDNDNQKSGGEGQTYSVGGAVSSSISFASPTFVPSITMPFTSRQFSFTAKVGGAMTVAHPNFFISGYVSKQRIDPQDTLLALPSYGYLHYQDGARNRSSLLDFNREKEMVYREKPPMPHIAVPMYTYDAFSITGEGTGGMFRAYRGDIGFVHDHFIRTKDESNRLSLDIGLGNMVHGGVDLNINRAFTQNGPWLGENTLRNVIDFKSNSGAFEAVYFRNPGEKAINSKSYYETLGGDDVVTVGLYQAGPGSSSIQATNRLLRYRNKRAVGSTLLTPGNAVKPERDKRTQVISYLTAKEAEVAGLSRYIDNYTVNQFATASCTPSSLEAVEGSGTGLLAEYFRRPNFRGAPKQTIDTVVNFDWAKGPPFAGFPADTFSVRLTGRVKAPATGTYTFTTNSDDGVRLWLNDSLVINQWNDHGAKDHSATVNLIAGELYKLKMEYYENKGKAVIKLFWTYPGKSREVIGKAHLFPPQKEEFKVGDYLTHEKRVNSFRKPEHISEITVLNGDGRRYVYGIPVYNLKQKEATFAVAGATRGNKTSGLTGYTHGTDNTTRNRNGKDWYFNSEETPAYAHSFLLTGILSPDYTDVTGNGISEDDGGDAIKFTYSKVNGSRNPYRWRAPYVQDSVTFNEGLKTDSRDDKGSYVYGEKELWYLHTVESKTMMATFTVESRMDLFALDESGRKYDDGSAKRLKEINLYNKADFLKKGTAARPIKTVHFEYSYELCKGVNRPLNDTGKLTLKRIWFTYNGNAKGKQNPYVFHYNGLNPGYNSKSFDRWGNYKDPLQNQGSSAANPITNAEYPYALQDSLLAAQNAAAWTLDSVYLPSGGSLKVTFESDDYGYVQNRRALQLCKLVGLGTTASLPAASAKLYSAAGDHLFVFIKVPQPVSSRQDVYQNYLAGVQKLFFRLSVKMPSDALGSGNEYVPCYAELDPQNGYGFSDPNTIWVKLRGISLKGDGEGDYSPLAKAAIQFLRLNLPSKAYPGSEGVDNMDLEGAVNIVFSMAENIRTAFNSFDRTARGKGWAVEIDTSRTFVRLLNPDGRKYGGGHRVKRVTLYDKWDQMTGQRPAAYGKEYSYTTRRLMGGTLQTVCSGVASYEPAIGGEENPFRQPIEYVEKVSALGPVTLGYSEEPLGESLFPSAGVGYSQVQVRSIHYKNIKSANGFEETGFYTAYDFPTLTDRTVLDGDTKKRYKPALSNFLRINARHYVTLSQGFKVELNDMHGKLRYQASYAETDRVNPVTYTENIYKVEDPRADAKVLSNAVAAISPEGTVDTAAVIGKDVELMVDMREQLSVTNGNNINLNTDMFAVPFLPPFFLIPSFLNLAQREETRFRSAATLKVIQRYGILDSVIHIDKGSKVSTKDVLYDSETGEVLLTRTQNEFNDPLYSFTYPAHWAYESMGLAYKNIDIIFPHVSIREGKIVAGLPGADSSFFSSGDEILVAGKQKTGTPAPDCTVPYSSFPAFARIWAIDSSVTGGGAKSFYFIDRQGKPYNGFDVTLKVIRSGRRNVHTAVGSVASLGNPLVKNIQTGQYQLSLSGSSQVLNASALELKQVWNVDNPVCSTRVKTCPPGYTFDPENPAQCIRITTAEATVIDSVSICLANYQNVNYSACGSFIYSADHSSCSRIQNNNFWVNVEGYTGGACDPTSGCVVTYPNVRTATTEPATGSKGKPSSAETYSPHRDTTQQVRSPKVSSAVSGDLLAGASIVTPDSLIGPLNRTGVWVCQGTQGGSFQPVGQWVGFTRPVYFPQDGTYYFGMGADNRMRVSVDSVVLKELSGDVLRNFEIWHIYPLTVSKGWHAVRVEGYNAGDVALFGLEIYNNTEAEIRNARCYYGCNNGLNLLFSTIDAVDQKFYTYSCPDGYTLDGSTCQKIEYAPARDSLVAVATNHYVDGLLGNWRGYRNYVYYGSRKESDPAEATNIRSAGTFREFAPFWSFAGQQLKPQHDTTRWVWNSEVTQFNRKGLEVENTDPLGRFNTGLYGYGLTLPVAVVQNSRSRESVFEGFEDYAYSVFNCDTCSVLRHFDIGSQAVNIVSGQRHSGKYSLKVAQGNAIGFPIRLSPDSLVQTALQYTTATNACLGGQAGLQSIAKTSRPAVSGFSPVKGQNMVLSLWVKEEQDCNCSSFVSNRVTITFTGAAQTYTFRPSGNIIEGWQRYESVFTIPAGASEMVVSFEATGTSPIYIDDVRLHPYNAHMKSFVYNPVDLRLMAELDENNYASFYEYDDDGTLIRVKKETERGVKTVNETRSALVKN